MQDVTPDGTAIIEYNIQKDRIESVLFVEKSLSTKIHFTEKTPDEIGAW